MDYKKMYSTFNSLLLGIVLGLVVPVISFFFFYNANIDTTVSLEHFFDVMIQGKVISQLLALCVIPNLAPFFIAIWLNLLKTARGVLIMTVLLAITSAVLKFMV